MENRGLRVNVKKTKFMISGAGLDMLHDTGALPCAVCRSGVGATRLAVPIANCGSIRSAVVLRTDYM